MAYDVFISYARRDGTPLAQKLARGLREAGLLVFWDQDSIPAGANWEQTLDDALEKAEHIIVILTPHSVASEEVAAEWRPMLSKGKSIIPIMYLPCEVPRRLSMRQYIDFRDEAPFQIAMTELIEAINTKSEKEIQIELSGEELIRRGISYYESGQPDLSVRDYLEAMLDKDVNVRLQALRLLGKAKRVDTLAKLLETLRTETEDVVKAEILETVRRIVEVEEWQVLRPNLMREIQHAFESENPDVRRQAIRVYAYGAVLETAPVIVRSLLNDPDGMVRYQAALALGRLQTDEAKVGLLLACSDPYPDVRRAAVMALGRYGDRGIISKLEVIAIRDKDANVRVAARDAVREIEQATQ